MPYGLNFNLGLLGKVTGPSAAPFVGILDTYPNASAAYSLRKLRAAYSGSAIRVRRSSDDSEQDIGFDSNNELDQTALTTFVGAGDGFVVTWYDQTGGINFTQTVAFNQPQIVLNGAVIVENSKPALDFNGTAHYMETSGYLVQLDANDAQVSVVIANDKPPSLTGYIAGEADGTSSTQWGFAFNEAVDCLVWINGTVLGELPDGHSVIGFEKTGGAGTGLRTAQAYANGATNGASSNNVQINTTVNNTTRIGTHGWGSVAREFFDGRYQEFISYKNTTNDVVDIQQNQVAYWL